MFSVLVRDCECWDDYWAADARWGKPETGLHWEFWNRPGGPDEAARVQFGVMDWHQDPSDFWAGAPGHTHL